MEESGALFALTFRSSTMSNTSILNARVTIRRPPIGVLTLLGAVLCIHASAQAPVATIEDAIAMVRIQYSAGLDGSVGAFSPDGSKFAAVTWRGDVARNINVHSLLVFDVRATGGQPATVLSRDFEGDAEDQVASPITRIAWLPDNRTLAFIGRERSKPGQVYTVDVVNRQVRQLTNHPTSVRSFVLGPDGSLKAFSAVADDPRDAGRRKRLEEDGVFTWDAALFPSRRRYLTPMLALALAQPGQIRQYFLAGRAEPFFDSRQSRPSAPLDFTDPKVALAPQQTLEDEGALRGWASLTGDPQGTRALLFPYGLTAHEMRPERYAHYATANAYARRVAAPYGIVDLATGRIDRLVDAPHPQFRDGGEPLWAPDGRTVIVYTLQPLDSPDPSANASRAAEPPQWMEVDIATRRLTPLGIPQGWRVVRWDATQRALILTRGNAFARFSRRSDGTWGELSELGTVNGLNSWYTPATNGALAIGVQDATLSPPELAAFDFSSKKTNLLTNFNPALHSRTYGAVEQMRWAHKYDKTTFAFLIKPVGYTRGTRYPLVILLDDGTLRQEGEPFLLDAAWQLSGHAIQMLAAQGFVVLYPRETPALRGVIETKQEGEVKREHIETAIAELDRAGLIDPTRVGISGWSRAGYHAHYLMIHSPGTFKAATTIDGGTYEYTSGMRPFLDEELQRVRTPLLLEAHGPGSLISHGAMADRLDALGKPVDILYFPTASHSTTRPQHRLRSLSTHIDWWRFWLKDQEDPSPAKREQYSHWRALRAQVKSSSASQ
jgi:dipeptidyl aminopeptidase/acylaminoacyl peptidase